MGFTSSFETQRESNSANTAAIEEKYAPTHQPTSDSATPDPRDQAISDLQQKVAALQASLGFQGEVLPTILPTPNLQPPGSLIQVLKTI